jgi:hypothetical protein
VGVDNRRNGVEMPSSSILWASMDQSNITDVLLRSGNLIDNDDATSVELNTRSFEIETLCE